MELETQVQVAENLGYLNHEEAVKLFESCSEIGRLLNGLISSLCRP
jgi:four helix bundle protein